MPNLDLSDEDILDAMRHIPGYLDVSTVDFREIYGLAHGHALERLFHDVRAGTLMRVGIEPLHPGMTMVAAARSLAQQGLKSLPVVDEGEHVIGMLTETDFLRRLRADTLLELLLRLFEEAGSLSHRCHTTAVRGAMTAPAISLPMEAGFRDILAGFDRHEGRSMPVVDAQGRLRGLLLRKDFLSVYRDAAP